MEGSPDVLFSEKSKVGKQCEWFYNSSFKKCNFYLYILAKTHNFTHAGRNQTLEEMRQRWEKELSFCTLYLSVLSEFSNHVYVLLLF